ncbi:uncharacterized protein G2W53_041945 [Senna tora]|uniref:Uncharacterized protein n=1 Tax=Senna tora TaxID=362788 RepID=A0A834W3C2_9FABA|nr:uncharacterized protein G2W53_041945 [Senna tora]
MTTQKTCCASESNTSVRVVFANRSGFDGPIGVVFAQEERGSCLNIFWTTNRGWISETFTNYKAKDLLPKLQITVGSQKPSRTTRQKTCCASESNTSVRVVFENCSGFDAPIGVVLAWEERGSCLKIFQMTITIESQKPSRITRQKSCCASESNRSIHVVFANRSGFDAPIGVVLEWEERGSCLNIFRKTNRVRISETFTNYEAEDSLRKNLQELRGKSLVAQVSQTRRFALYLRTGVVLLLVLAWEERGSCLNIFWTTNRGRISETFTNYEAKDLLRNESNTSVRVVLANCSGFDAPIGVFLAWEELGSCIKIFRRTNRGRITETFTNYEAIDLLRKNLHELQGKRLVAQVSQARRFVLYLRIEVVWMLQLELSWHGRSVDHVLTYFGLQITVGSQKPSRTTRQKTCCASESNTSVRVVFENCSGFDAPIGVVLAWEERGSCLKIFQMTITVESQKPSRITRQKSCFASESKRSVRVVFANRSGFDAPIAVVLEWEERGSCLNIFRMTNRVRISETFTKYEAKDLFRK